MKLLRVDQEQFQFEISREEKHLLNVLRLYPLVPASHHQLSQGCEIPDREENQRLLVESLQAQRDENQKKVVALLNEANRFTEIENGHRAKFTRGEIEWLLQVFNDVRIGSWLALGSPAAHPEIKPGMSNQTMSHIVTMDIAGFFELAFLRAVSGDLAPEHE